MIRDDVDHLFIGKTDAQILRELAAIWGHRGFVLPDEQLEQQTDLAVWPDDETEGQTH
jgi:hypothetical protein